MSGAKRSSRRASYLALLAIMIVVLLGITALVVDVGTLSLADSELEVAVDAAALAGASQIDGTPEGLQAAAASALSVASQNEVRHEGVTLDRSDLEFGIWDAGSRTFTPSSDVASIDAIRVSAVIPDVPTPFAGVAFARAAVDVQGTAVGQRPPPEPVAWTPCFLPVAVPKCIADAMSDPGPGFRSFQMANDSDDNVGWAHPEAVNARTVDLALEAAANGECEEGTPRFEEGGIAYLQNGVVESQVKHLGNLLRLSAVPWELDPWGAKPPADEHSLVPEVQYPGLGTLQGPIAIIDEGGVACDQVRFGQTKTVDRLAWGVIYDAFSKGSHKGFQIFIDVDHDWEAPGGGSGSGNVVDRPPGRLVQ